MSLRPSPVPAIPLETARVTRLAFPKGHAYLTLADTFGTFCTDELFRPLFPSRGQPALAPWRLALVTLLQFAEGLSDRQAADTVRASLLWKYLLRLELTDPGFDASVLSEFRTRLVAGGAEHLLFDTLLERFREHHLLKERGRQRTDSTHVQAAVRELNRLEAVGEAFRHTLNVLAEVAPQWLLAHLDPAWTERYGQPLSEWRLPQTAAAREALARQIGGDGFALLTALYDPAAPVWLREIPAVGTLRELWLQQYTRTEADDGLGGSAVRVGWRTPEELPPAPTRLISPHDPEARAAKKRETSWLGYKVHLTETCDRTGPALITDVQTRSAGEVDSEALPHIHAALAARDLLPQEHLVDAGYVDGGTLVASRETHQIDLVGPAPADTTWQSQAQQGFGAAAFVVHWEAQWAACPGGKRSVGWGSKRQRGQEVLQISFAREDCQACDYREQCTRSERGRRLTLRPQAEYEALAAARARQQTAAFWEQYAPRAGIEGTHAQAVRVGGLRRSRYVGQSKTHLQHLFTAAALNLLRVAAWLAEVPRARTRQSAWTRLVATAT